MKLPFVSSNRREAVHYLDRTKFKAGEIACGTPVEYRVGRDNITFDTQSVTCRECAETLWKQGIAIRGENHLPPKMF